MSTSSFRRRKKTVVSKSTQTENGLFLSRSSITSAEQNSTDSSSVQRIRRPREATVYFRDANSVLQPQRVPDTTVVFDGSSNVQQPDRVREATVLVSSSNTFAERTFTDRNEQFQRPRETTQYMIRRSIDERFFKNPDRMTPKEHTLWETAKFAFRSLGIVFGDLATSPLYVYPSISCAQTPGEDDYLGILSLIFWTLTLIGIIKYTFIVLYADDHGEGGAFAMYSLLCQYTDVGGQARKLSKFTAHAEHQLSHFAWEEKKPNKVKTWLENHKLAQQVLLFVVMMGTCMFIGDGILTPAISVLSAIGGIKTEFPSISQTVIVCVSAIILVVLFCVQSYGTEKVAFLFSPIMALWLLTTPMRAGSEAMFADLGHFNRLSIQMAFSMAIYPAVILTYSGQTAYLIHNPDDYIEGFFKMIPKPVFWPMLTISTFAAIVASQGLITATFSVVKQSMALDFFPPVKVVHTSEDSEGQIYSPEVNWGLMILCVAVVFGFKSGSDIGNAFVMISWNYGRQKKFDYETKNKLNKKALGQVLLGIGDMRVPGVCFFYTDLFHGVPPIVNHYVRNVRTLHQVLIFTTIRHIPIKTVLPSERFLVGRIGYKGVYRCVARYGYMDLLTSETTYFLDQVTQCLIEHIGSALDISDNPDDIDEEDEWAKEIKLINEAKAAGAVYVVGRSEFKVDENTSCIDRVFAGALYPFLVSICRSPVSSMHIPPACFLEVGMHYDLL